MDKVKSLKRKEDGTTYGYKCTCGAYWKIYQQSDHTVKCTYKEDHESQIKAISKISPRKKVPRNTTERAVSNPRRGILGFHGGRI